MQDVKYIAKNLNFEKEVLEKVKKLGIKNFTNFVRAAVADKIREMELQSLKEHYQSDEMKEVMDDFDCASSDGL
jgi:hypothetical protein